MMRAFNRRMFLPPFVRIIDRFVYVPASNYVKKAELVTPSAQYQRTWAHVAVRAVLNRRVVDGLSCDASEAVGLS